MHKRGEVSNPILIAIELIIVVLVVLAPLMYWVPKLKDNTAFEAKMTARDLAYFVSALDASPHPIVARYEPLNALDLTKFTITFVEDKNAAEGESAHMVRVDQSSHGLLLFSDTTLIDGEGFTFRKAGTELARDASFGNERFVRRCVLPKAGLHEQLRFRILAAEEGDSALQEAQNQLYGRLSSLETPSASEVLRVRVDTDSSWPANSILILGKGTEELQYFGCMALNAAVLASSSSLSAAGSFPRDPVLLDGASLEITILNPDAALQQELRSIGTAIREALS